MGEIAAKYRLCRCRCKINNLMREETGTSVLFILHGPPALLTPFSPPYLPSSGSYPSLASARSFSPTLPGSDLRFPEIAGSLGTFPASEIASDAHPVASAAKLQSHRRILALGLTEHTEKQGLSELLANERAKGPLLEYLKSTEVGAREGGKKRELEWERKNDHAGEELLGA